ncbi:TrbI/VirB10 family protein [Acinetobacter baumannii]|uniref:TraB n=2 Tax=Acinetobacter baumannii TaxID=470 RepID=U5QEY0_ACIBA|nr:TrbI/VirB10 family protein [Acinetobacter baumannii]AGY56189.1 TraB [Acinetobacter baumannii]AMQ95368.1 TraB [Acinetobacter baumannii]ARG29699.1 conjugal transfer protein TraB [Acinetobacter baumannii]EHU1323345.1 conjugal transfer protein TraB [Acinetobacter baumannii]EHU1433887.1 conjugal transfer protein TraB [Acinetobacter baumannii]
MSNDIDLENPNDKLKKKQIKWLAILGTILFIIVAIFLFSGSPPEETNKTQAPENAVNVEKPGDAEEQDKWRQTAAIDQEAQKKQIDDLTQTVNSQVAQNDALKSELSIMNERISQIANRSESRVVAQPTNTNPPNLGGIAGTSSAYPNKQGLHGQSILLDPNGTGIDPQTGERIPLPNNIAPVKTFGIIDMNKSIDEQGNTTSTSVKSQRPEKTTFIPDGSFVRVVMINGVDAPTGGQAQSDPIPVVFQTVGKFDMPNNYKMNIKGCRFVGAAWGELSSERVKATIQSGNCIINGQTVPIQIKGQVVGEDGKTGIRGRVVSKQGQILAKAALASAMEAIGGLYGSTVGTASQSALGTVRTISGSELKQAAVGGAISGGAEKLSDFYMQRANDLFPVIEVSAGRTLEIVVQQGGTVANQFLITKSATPMNQQKRILMDD